MKYSFHIPIDHALPVDEFTSPKAVSEMALGLERAGVDACYVTDHPLPSVKWLEAGGHESMDPFVTLSFIAAASTKLKLHTNIIVLPYRNPFMTAKQVATLDVLSQGRLILGIGAGYLRAEFDALGMPLEGRGERMNEAIKAMKLAWRGEKFDFTGDGYKAVGNISLPKPVQTPHPPIWVGGTNDAAMRRAAQLCEGWLPYPTPKRPGDPPKPGEVNNVDDLAVKITEIKKMRKDAGVAAPLDIAMVPFGLPMGVPNLPDKAKITDTLRKMKQAGVTWTVVALPFPSRAKYLENVAWFSQEVMSNV